MPCNHKSHRIIAFIDDDNISVNQKTDPPERFNDELGFVRFKDWLSSFGEVIAIFVFAPATATYVRGEMFYKLGFVPISCPKVLKHQEETRQDYEKYLKDEEFTAKDIQVHTEDTTDQILIRLGELIVNNMLNVTHICIASGDGHFVPLANLARKNGKKVMTMIASVRSASRELIKATDRDPAGKRMIYIFNPIRD